MMPAAKRSIVIQKPVDQVWDFVADGRNATKWRPGVLDVSHLAGQGLGETWRQGVKGPGGRRIDADYEVTAFEPSSRLAFKTIAGPVRPRGEYRLVPDGAGTQLSFSLEAEISGWKKVLMGGAVQSTMDAEMANLDRLKAVLEA
jgi:uncharacterized protein YndB with AHSA1/START domain